MTPPRLWLVILVLAGAAVIGCGGGSGRQSAKGPAPTGGGDYLDAVLKARQKAAEIESFNNLAQLALTFHNYHDAYSYLPVSGIKGDRGKPLLSWRVEILPYIEEQVLFLEFKLDEPWDSPHNKKLLDKMPKLYRNPRFQKPDEKTHLTYYQGIAGDGGILSGKPANLQFQDIANVNGLTSTVMLLEAGDPVPWTKPEDYVHDLKKPLPPLGGPSRGDFLVAFCNRDVKKIPAKTPEKIIRCMLQWNNKEAFTLP